MEGLANVVWCYSALFAIREVSYLIAVAYLYIQMVKSP